MELLLLLTFKYDYSIVRRSLFHSLNYDCIGLQSVDSGSKAKRIAKERNQAISKEMLDLLEKVGTSIAV